MRAFRDAFYSYLRDEVDRDLDDRDRLRPPFLWQFLRDKKEEAPRLRLLKDALEAEKPPAESDLRRSLDRYPLNPKRQDAYGLLREQALLRQLGYESEETCFLDLLDLIVSQKVRVTPEIFEQIQSLAGGLTGDSGQKDTPPSGSLVRQIASLARTLRQRPTAASRPGGFSKKLDALTEDVLYEILMDDAKTYLYDSGRKADRSMQLISAFFERDGAFYELEGHLDDGGALLTDARAAETRTLFDLLDRDASRRSVCVPVIIDPASGLGLYIIGAGKETPDNIMIDFNEWPALRQKHNCIYAIFNFDEAVYSSDLHPDDMYGFLKFGLADSGLYPGSRLDDARAYYDSRRIFTRDAQALEMYIDVNRRAPEGCPASFLKYFEGGGAEDFDKAVSRYIEEERLALTP